MIAVDTSGLRRFGSKLRRDAPDLAKALRASLRDAGDVVAVEARVLAARASTEIPGTVRVRVSGLNVSVLAGENEPSPGEAAAFNHRGMPGQFRHPVFGNRSNWVSQRAVPFMEPALASQTDRVVELVDRALDVALRGLAGGD